MARRSQLAALLSTLRKKLLKVVINFTYPQLFGMMFGIGKNILNIYSVSILPVKGHTI